MNPAPGRLVELVSRFDIGWGGELQAVFDADDALLVTEAGQELREVSGVIPGSVHVPLSVLYWRLDPSSESKNPEIADLQRRVILVCAHGYSSSLAASTLQHLGFHRATDVVGGFEAWAIAGLPVEDL